MQREECNKRVLYKCKHCTDSAPMSSTHLFYSVFVMSVISEKLDDGTVRIKLHYGNAPGIFPCLPNEANAYNFRKVTLPSFTFFETLEN